MMRPARFARKHDDIDIHLKGVEQCNQPIRRISGEAAFMSLETSGWLIPSR